MRNLPRREKTPLQLYHEHITKKIRRVWKPAKDDRRRVEARFYIHRDGTLGAFEILESSKDAEYDAAAKAALDKAAPFDPWPPEVAMLREMEIRYIF